VTSPRVVSLVPSVTETLLAWGVTPVAVTRFCEQPGLPAVGGTKDPDVTAVVALTPDLVVVNDEENRREDADALLAAGLDLEVIRISSVDDVSPELRRLRGRLGLPPLDEVPLPEPAPVTRRAFVPIWKRPWMTMAADTYGSTLLARLGVANVYADAPDRYPTTTLEEAAARRPDVVLAPSEPYPFAERHRAVLEEVAPVVFVDGQDLFWWGSRTPAAAARLREALASIG
jgi:ABC-type Fe3+-hydroxamate transport system substrate-binding protein